MSVSSPVDVKPLAMGELVDRAASFWRLHFRSLFQLYLVLRLVEYGLLKTVMLGTPFFSKPHPNPSEIEVRELVLGLGGITAIGLIAAWLAWLTTAAAAPYCWGHLTGRPIALGESVRRGLGRAGRMTVAFALSLLQLLVALVLAAIVPVALGAGAGAAFGGSTALGIVVVVVAAGASLLAFTAAFLWYVLRFIVTPHVMVLEDLGPAAALRRSNELVSGRVGPGFFGRVKVRATVVMTAVIAIWTAVTLVTSAPAVIIQAIYGHMFDPSRQDPSAIPQLLLVPAELLSQTAQAIFSPLYLAFTTIFYLDMRVRREGLDLALRLKQP